MGVLRTEEIAKMDVLRAEANLASEVDNEQLYERGCVPLAVHRDQERAVGKWDRECKMEEQMCRIGNKALHCQACSHKGQSTD